MSSSMRFLSLPNARDTEADILILPVPYEQTVTYKTGTSQGPKAILDASDQLEFYEEDMGWCPTEFMKIAVLPEIFPDMSGELAFFTRLFDRVDELPRDNLLIALGGEHSITPEMVFARIPQGGTVVQIDAHADLRPSYHGSIYNHACPMYRLRQRGYELVQIGIRSLHAREAAMISADDGITTFYDTRLQSPEGWRALLERLCSLQGSVWLTIDMDGFDPNLISGVGTPQPGGLSWRQGVEILSALLSNPGADIRGVDIVELIPEPSRVSDMMAVKLVQKCISFWGKAKQFDHREARGSQIGVEDE